MRAVFIEITPTPRPGYLAFSWNEILSPNSRGSFCANLGHLPPFLTVKSRTLVANSLARDETALKALTHISHVSLQVRQLSAQMKLTQAGSGDLKAKH